MNSERIKVLNDKEIFGKGDYILYWMQQSQRAQENPALEYAIHLGNKHDLGVVVCFGLMPDYPEANERHFAFMLEGLAETRKFLHKRGLKFLVKIGSPPRVALYFAQQAAAVICDCGYLKHQREWRKEVGKKAKQQVIQVEGDIVVPVVTVSEKREYAARTIRPKLNKLQDTYLQKTTQRNPKKSSLNLPITSDFDVSKPERALKELAPDHNVPISKRFTGGTSAARKRLTNFIIKHLQGYAERRSDPGHPQCSELSPYLHFGQLSPVEIALKIYHAKNGSIKDKDAFLEELIVRRELAINFVYFEPEYDSYNCLPDWAKTTLQQHKNDKRAYTYTRKQLESSETHDEAWNAAMTEMRQTGYMHNYMRMYWGKKILEWTNTPRYGYATILYLNNKYFLDGRDPNSYANIAWVFGLHDRPWQERSIFGKVRYMNLKGLRRKFDIDAYIDRVKQLTE